MKFVSWNVNGLRAALKKGFIGVVSDFGADIFAIQETKCREGQVDFEIPNYTQIYSYAQRPGYSGTAVFVKREPLQIVRDIFSDSEKDRDEDVAKLDSEGRVLALEYEKFWFVCCYTPNAQKELARIEPRLKWGKKFGQFLHDLESGKYSSSEANADFSGEKSGVSGLSESSSEKSGESAFSESSSEKSGESAFSESSGEKSGESFSSGASGECRAKDNFKPVIICGDLNVAHNEIDLKNPKTNRGNAGFSDEERADFSALLDSGFTDTFRLLYPDKKDAYSWWSYRANSRARNVGWRIDYFLVSDTIKQNVKESSIHAEVMGSDHCPISLDIDI